LQYSWNCGGSPYANIEHFKQYVKKIKFPLMRININLVTN